MQRVFITGVIWAFLTATAVPMIVRAQVTESDGVFCSVFGWLVQPIGFCVDALPAAVPIPVAPVVQAESPEPASSPIIIEYSTTTQPVYNEYVTIEQTGVTESLLNTRVAEIMRYIERLPSQATARPLAPIVVEAPMDNEFVTKEYLLKSLDRVYESDDREVLTSFVDTTLSGTTYVSGFLGVGTSTPQDVLSVAGPIYLAESAPADTTNRLYNFGSELYWNGTNVSSSTASSWSAASGDVFRTTGRVAIGTSTPSETLTVDGTALFTGTTTGVFADLGGQVCNVNAYGAVGDNSTINDAAIARAIAACPEGGTVFFPMGQYRISSPIVLDRPVTLRGSYAPRWSYSSTPRSSIRADFGSFSGVAMVHVRDRTISGEVEHNNGGRLEYLSLDGGSASTDVDGIYFEGLVRDWKLTDVDISQVTGNGFEAAVGTGSGNPRGFTIRGLSIYSADGHGFRATALNDSYIEDLLSVGNALRGIYVSSMGETKINNSRAVFNGLTGLYIDGASNNGGLMFTDFSTDRNDRHGVRISLTGTTTVTFNGLLTRRDGANLSGGSETPYAGVAVIGTTTERVAPVFINGLTQIVGVDDSGNPPMAPQTGVRVTNAQYVKVEGQLWGVNEAYRDDGGNDTFIVEEGSIVKAGVDGVTDNPPPIYHNKWVAATSTKSLTYDGQINIGSSTDSRLLNIVADSGAGARFRDTTNNVIFDMRAEDFQGFFGTFSNHQLRFQTNNTSRLTIDTNGNIGIGTTTPSAQLTVTDTVRFATITGGNLTTDALGNVTVSSDERLKDITGAYTAGLDEILSLNPILYKWTEDSGYDTKTNYAGFSAQNVQDFLPEAVGENPDGFLTLSDRPIIAAIVQAIKEIWQTMTGMQDRVAELEREVQALQAALNMQQQSGDQVGAESPSTADVNVKVDEDQASESQSESEEMTDQVPDESQPHASSSASSSQASSTQQAESDTSDSSTSVTDPGVATEQADNLEQTEGEEGGSEDEGGAAAPETQEAQVEDKAEVDQGENTKMAAPADSAPEAAPADTDPAQ